MPPAPKHRLAIRWSEATSDCDQAGCSGGYARGARATLDGRLIFHEPPRPSCCDSNWVRPEEILRLAAEKMRIELENLNTDRDLFVALLQAGVAIRGLRLEDDEVEVVG